VLLHYRHEIHANHPFSIAIPTLYVVVPNHPIHLRKAPIHTMSTKQGSDRVTWSALPRKDQLFVLCLVRFSEPVVRLSIVSYIYYQLRSLDESLSSPEIVKQAAWLQTVFMISQCVSSWFLGRLADSPRGGRKLVTMVSLLGSCEFTCPIAHLHCQISETEKQS
jgi:hypothetical protein